MARDKTGLVEEWVCSLQGVQSAKVVLNDVGEIAELHVLSDDQRSPKQIVRDIETLLVVKMDVRVDHKRISIVQFAKDPVASEARISMQGLSFKLNKVTAEVSVGLALGEKTAEVTITGPNSKQNQGRLVASATLTSLKQLLGGMVEFVVEDVVYLNFACGQAAVVALSLITPGEEETLVGSSLVKEETKEAVVRATLDAVNRRWQRLLT